jgi:hypothetical protein
VSSLFPDVSILVLGRHIHADDRFSEPVLAGLAIFLEPFAHVSMLSLGCSGSMEVANPEGSGSMQGTRELSW